MVMRSDARTPATSTVRGKQSPECSNCVMRRRIPSSTISKTISICRCKRLRLGWPQAKAKKTKRLRCCVALRTPRTFWASIRFRPVHLFRFANNLAVCCSKGVNQRKHNGNLKQHSRSIRDDSEVYMEPRAPPNKTATRKVKAVITQSWRHKPQKLPAHEMN